MVDPQTKNAIRTKVNELVDKGNRLFHTNVRDVFIFYKNISEAGLASFEKGQYVITLKEDLVTDDFAAVLNDTLSHEVAHLICFYIGMTGGPVDYKHGAQWRRIDMALGGTGKATVHVALRSPARPHKYVSDKGETVFVPTRVHNILQKQFKVYKTKTGGNITASGYVPPNASTSQNPK